MSKKLIFVILLALGMVFQGANLWADDDAIMDVDDNAASFSGTWGRSTVRILYYGDDYQYASGSGGVETARATFTTAQTADITGRYQVYVRWTAGNMRATNANYRIYDSSNVYLGQCTKDQRYNGGAWQNCATVNLISGRRGAVRLGNGGVPTNRYVCADAVRFVRVSKDSFDITDEAGLDFDQTPTTTSISSISTCTTRTILKQVTVSVPSSASSSYVVCRATGRTFHSQTNKWVFYSIDDATGTGYDVWTYTGVATTTSTYNNYAPYAMQKVYTYGSAGGSFTYYLKACRQDTATTGTAYHDDFVCEVYPTRY